jgi:isopentenyl phosphate kinase
VIFLKLGGSLITDKTLPETPRLEAIRRLAEEISRARSQLPELQLLIGHGSGSFGHIVAARYGTHRGASSKEDWAGFAEVWSVAGRLNRLVVDALRAAGLPAMAFPPSSSVIAEAGEIVEMAVEPIRSALEAGLVPVVAGDVAFDRRRGSTIVSTERVFFHLARSLRPTRLLLAGIERGVYADYPANTQLLPAITEKDLPGIALAGAATTDVTGGMADKVLQALRLAQELPGLEVRIFSGEEPGRVSDALLGGTPGTLVGSGKHSSDRVS